MAYDRLAEAIIKHSKLIVVAWIVIFLVALVPAVNALGSMSYSVDDMGLEDSESMEGAGIIAEYFPRSDSGTDVSSSQLLVLSYQDEQEKQAAYGILLEQLNQSILNGGFDFTDADGNKVQKIEEFSELTILDCPSTVEGNTSGILIAPITYTEAWNDSNQNVSDDTPVLRQQITDALADSDADDAIEIALTGSPAISYDMETGAMEDVSHIDVFTILMVIILVGLFFRSFITSFTPPLTIVFALIITLGVVYGLMYVMDIFFLTEMLLIVSMFGAGCDYCIFIIARYREEMRDGKNHHDALHSAIKWAGESITISGASVIIGFGAMSICSFSMISTMGICLALGIVIALLAALTFIPSVLNIVGDRIFWPTRIKEYQPGGKATKGWFAWAGRVGHSYFEKSSHFTLKHAKAIAIVAVLITVPAAYVAATSETSYDMTSSLMTGESDEGMQLIGEYADQGMIYPNYVVMEYDEPVAKIVAMYNPLGQPAGYGLVWTDNWTDGGQKQTVDNILEGFAGDSNIAEKGSVYQWNDVLEAHPEYDVSLSLEELLEVAIQNPMQALVYLGNAQSIVEVAQESTNGTTQLILNKVLAGMQSEYETYVDLIIGSMGPAGSVTIPDEFKSMIATYMMVTTGAPTIDYLVNYNLGYIGGDFKDFVAANPIPPTNVQNGEAVGNVTFIEIMTSTREAAMSQTSMDTLSYMQDVVKQYSGVDGITATWLTGSAAIMYDISNVISDEFTGIEILVIILIIILLFFVMRSYTIPFRSVLTILMSICWTLAATHLIFGDSVTWLIPLILLVVCLGLGMDYDILLTTRIKENVRANGMSNDEAIHHAVIHSGSVITICGLIMGGAFGTLMLSSMEMLQQFGFALCFAIVVDALIVRTYVVPAVMKILGDWNWKGPRFLQRIGTHRTEDTEQ